MQIAIAGAGTTGLACAHTLLDSGAPVNSMTIMDARAEVGSPTHKPGRLNQSDTWLPRLYSWGLSDQAFPHSTTPESVNLRREWLEKSLAIGLAERGARLHVKTRIISSESQESGCSLVCTDVGGLEGGTWNGDLVLDALGPPPSALSQETDHLVLKSLSETDLISIEKSKFPIEMSWNGIITSSRLSTPPESYSLERGDGTWETWYHGMESELDLESALEVFTGRFSDWDSACIDASLARGVSLAQAALQRM